MLYLGYGVVGGIGLGLGYVTPVATAAKWFPDKKGLVTGMVVMGFGFGAMPSFVLDVFGAKYMAVVYGSILTAWGCGGIVGPQLIAFLKDHFAAQAAQYTFIMASVLLLTGLLLTLGLNNGKAGK